MFRVARKYQVDSLIRVLVRHVSDDWPTTLTEWILRRAQVAQFEKLEGCSSDLFEDIWTNDLFPEPAAAIRLAIDFNIPSILPCAFYTLAGIKPENDWDMYHDKGGNDNPIYDMECTARWLVLDRDSLYFTILGRDKLQRRQYEFHLAGHCSSCTSIEKCSKILTGFDKTYHEELRRLKTPIPLQTLLDAIPRVAELELCLGCHFWATRQIDKEMQSIWKDLPQIFSFDKMGISEC